MSQPSRSYSHETAAEALFFKNTTASGTVHQAIRVEVPELGLEYTDNAYIGKDPEGIFYYDAASDMSGDAKAKVTKVTANGKNYVHIKFYTSYESETYAEFVAEDPFATVDAAGLNGSVRDGNWTSLNIGTANATIYKRTSESKITLTADSISKKATMNYSGRFDVDIKGTLFFKKFVDLTSVKAKFASYNNDRIVWYEDDYTGKDFVAYFIPFEGTTKTLGIAAANTVIISGVSWSNT
ncbi:hypothetical protein EI94DRAFT_1808505 [Lactarius quietus]|nr:hypothetical protein EI94DRAFT_1808505 [Lactarius quietus]